MARRNLDRMEQAAGGLESLDAIITTRTLLQMIPGLRLVELPEASWCCGSAGIYNITQPEMSAKLLARKMGHILSTGAPIVATANPGCAVQLEAGARGAGGKIEIVHPVTLLARAYRAGRPPE
jgi:glycolate oxidase iron-sulfur subunit